MLINLIVRLFEKILNEFKDITEEEKKLIIIFIIIFSKYAIF